MFRWWSLRGSCIPNRRARDSGELRLDALAKRLQLRPVGIKPPVRSGRRVDLEHEPVSLGTRDALDVGARDEQAIGGEVMLVAVPAEHADKCRLARAKARAPDVDALLGLGRAPSRRLDLDA